MMVPRKDGTQDETCARAALRRATSVSHQRMHGLEPFAQIAAGALPIEQYPLLLQSLFLFHSVVGNAASQSGWLHVSSAQRRLDLLRSDLALFGANAPAPRAAWPSVTSNAVLGALYAAEGSMLGGRVIARQLDYAFGSKPDGRRFFIGDHSDRAVWSRLILVLQERCTRPDALNAAIIGARSTFDWFEQCVMQFARPPEGV